jgi:hypothetical protein
MKFVFYASDKPREIMIAKAFAKGIDKRHAFELRRTADYGEDRIFEGPTPDTDIAIVFGVKGASRQIIKEHLEVGKHAIYLDKGYTRHKGEHGHTLYTRLSIDSSSPLRYMQRIKHGNDRFKELDIELKDRRDATKDGHILFCGSSQKYHDFNGLGDAQEFAEKVLFKLRKVSQRQLVYRPKPSWTDARPIPGALFSSGSQDIKDALRGCHLVVTHGSSVGMLAAFEGVPIMVFGDTLMTPIAESDITKAENPTWPEQGTRMQWACDTAYCQWTLDEMRSGRCLEYVLGEIAWLEANK